MSSSEQERARELAERIARRLASSSADESAGSVRGGAGDDVAALRASLRDIQRRLAHIESHLAHDESCEHGGASASGGRGEEEAGRGRTTSAASRPATTPARSMWLSGTYVPVASHPSQERFSNVGEAVSELVSFFEGEKTCSVEPGEKPCDHCGMCSSRGF